MDIQYVKEKLNSVEYEFLRTEWRSCLEHAEKIGLGTRDYELIIVK